ncbi:MAG: SDR family NAD(P)-dependent oxidoreductase [Dermatophilaceae bacterium]
MRVDGAHVLLTGATGALGAALTRRFADTGARVTLVARSRDALDALVAAIGPSAVALPADLTAPTQLAGLVGRAEAGHGPVDILVNNAGVETTAHLADTTADGVADAVALNLTAPAELARQAIPGMLGRGRGAIVNVSSLAGVATFPGMALYGATKAGLTALTVGLRAELRGTPISTLAVEIGPVTSPMMRRVGEHAGAAASFDRLLRARLLTMLDAGDVADRVLAAVAAGRPHLRLPRRVAVLAATHGAPRAVVRAALTGIPHGSPAPPPGRMTG